MNDFYIQLQICNLADSLVRNVNDNFKSVSFDLLDNGHIQVKVILKEYTEVEEEYIEDFSVEFSAIQKEDIVERVEVVTDCNSKPREHIVFSALE